METLHKKLVRDNIPEKIEKNGEVCGVKILDDIEYQVEIRKKLIEESFEVRKADTRYELVDELGDIMEVVIAIAESNGITLSEVEERRIFKKEKNGGFDKKIYLEWTRNDDK